ncbi:MAG: IS110 family transposase, partial [Butyrivibrio sp.]|nr:IS110 family transposase [Butyrivibrio sp.]
RFAGAKGLAIYELVLNSVTTRGDNPLAAITQDQCVDLISTSQKAADEINLHMLNIAQTIPEYKVLRSMAGVGDRLGPIILAEIGDVRRFHSGKALNAYAGNDAPPYQSGQFESRNRHISKRGNPALRKACFEVMQALKLTKPQDDPVYLFLLKKEQEGKPYNVAKMAAVNKFLRIYYARAMELYK